MKTSILLLQHQIVSFMRADWLLDLSGRAGLGLDDSKRFPTVNILCQNKLTSSYKVHATVDTTPTGKQNSYFKETS